MTEIISYIPSRVKNAAVGGHVAGVEDIFDDDKGKDLKEINADVEDTLAFHQSQINALNSQNYVTVDSYSSLPATGAVDTVYRVSNWDGTQQDPSVYSEYAWNGEDYVHLSTKTQIGEVFDISAYHATGGELAKYADLAAALNGGANIPQSLQKGGMRVQFVHSVDNKYVQWRLTSQNFSTDSNDWVAENEDFRNEVMHEVNEAIDSITPIEIIGDVTNASDEEDLTNVNVDGTDVLKFKDKAYAPLIYSGLGRKILRKNIVNGVNTLTQEMISDANTIYVIQYDFTLGEDITVPENCVLEFDGGSISGAYTVTGNNTGIEAGLVKIFGTDITLAGSWNVAEAYPEWFGAKGDGVTDDAIFINACINSFNKAILTKQNYYTTNTIQLKAKSVLESKTKNTTVNYNGSGDCVKFAKAETESIVRNISFVGDYTTYKTNNTIGLHFDDTEAGRGILLDNILISSFNTGIKARKTLWSSYITNCKFAYCNIQLDIYEALNIHISGCYFSTPSYCCCSLEAARCISFVNCNFGCENTEGSRFFNIYSTSTCTFTDCNFEACYVNSANGAATVQGGSVVTMNNCRFHLIKRADSYAGSCIIFYIAGTNAVNLTLINCIFYDNGDGSDYRLYYFFVHAAHHRVYLSGNRKTREGLTDSSFTTTDVYSPDNTVFQEVVTKTLGT